MANPFFAPSPLPYGLPPFAEIAAEHYRPAFLQGFADQLGEVERILAVTDAPTADNLLVPLDKSGQFLDRVSAAFYNKASADPRGVTDGREAELASLMDGRHDSIMLDRDLYRRIAQVREHGCRLATDAETRYLIERYFAEFTIAGAALDVEGREKLKEYNKRLSTLTTRFEKNLLADTNDLAVVVDDVADLDGLTPGEISAAAEAASERGLVGKHLITLVLPTGHPYLSQLTNRRLRERIMTASRSRGIRGGDHDNRTLVLEITRLRAERAALLGYSSHAAWVTADETARTPEAVADMLGRLAPAAARNAVVEQRDLESLAGHPIAAWDWAFYSEKVRSARYDVDTAAMRPYFEAERVLHDGVFFAATQLYGVTFA